jgi:hypothetical protein
MTHFVDVSTAQAFLKGCLGFSSGSPFQGCRAVGLPVDQFVHSGREDMLACKADGFDAIQEVLLVEEMAQFCADSLNDQRIWRQVFLDAELPLKGWFSVPGELALHKIVTKMMEAILSALEDTDVQKGDPLVESVSQFQFEGVFVLEQLRHCCPTTWMLKKLVRKNGFLVESRPAESQFLQNMLEDAMKACKDLLLDQSVIPRIRHAEKFLRTKAEELRSRLREELRHEKTPPTHRILERDLAFAFEMAGALRLAQISDRQRLTEVLSSAQEAVALRIECGGAKEFLESLCGQLGVEEVDDIPGVVAGLLHDREQLHEGTKILQGMKKAPGGFVPLCSHRMTRWTPGGSR